MEDFDEFWDLYNPDASYNNRRAATYREWQKCSDEKRRSILGWLRTNRPSENRNPFFFVQDFRIPKKLVMPAEEYYRIHGTQTEQDGWKRRHIPEEQRTVYEKDAG